MHDLFNWIQNKNILCELNHLTSLNKNQKE